MSGSGRPSWPLSGSGDQERYRREKLEEQLRYWSSREGLGLTQEEFEAFQEQNHRWPQSVCAAVEEVRKVAHGIDSESDVEPEFLVNRIAELGRSSSSRDWCEVMVARSCFCQEAA